MDDNKAPGTESVEAAAQGDAAASEATNAQGQNAEEAAKAKEAQDQADAEKVEAGKKVEDTTHVQAREAGHVYQLTNVGAGVQELRFMKKEVVDGELKMTMDGTTNEIVIATLIQRIEWLNGQMSSQFNVDAIRGLRLALGALEQRTADRKNRGVEGTAKE